MDVSSEHRSSDESQSALLAREENEVADKKERSWEKYKNTSAHEEKCLRSQRNVLSRSSHELFPWKLSALHLDKVFPLLRLKHDFDCRAFRVANACLSRTSKGTITRLLRWNYENVQIFLHQPLHFYEDAVSKWKTLLCSVTVWLKIIDKTE